MPQVTVGPSSNSRTATMLLQGTADDNTPGADNILVYNTDETNPVFLSDSNSFDPGNPDDCVPLPPLSGITYDGTTNVYARCAGNISVVVNVVPGASSFFQPAIINGSQLIDVNQLFYDGTPALGNLVDAIVTGTAELRDIFGNLALPGISAELNSASVPTVAVQMFQGGLNFYTWNGVDWAIAGAVSADAGTGKILFDAVNGMIFGGDIQEIGTIYADNWNAITLFSPGFSAGAPIPQYALEPTGVAGKANIRLRGQILLTGATAVDAPMFALPFAFGRNQDYYVPNNLSGAAAGQRIVRVASSGNVRCEAAGSNNNFLIMDGIVAPMS